MKKNFKVVSINLPWLVYDAIKEMAAADNRTPHYIMRLAIEDVVMAYNLDKSYNAEEEKD